MRINEKYSTKSRLACGSLFAVIALIIGTATGCQGQETASETGVGVAEPPAIEIQIASIEPSPTVTRAPVRVATAVPTATATQVPFLASVLATTPLPSPLPTVTPHPAPSPAPRQTGTATAVPTAAPRPPASDDLADLASYDLRQDGFLRATNPDREIMIKGLSWVTDGISNPEKGSVSELDAVQGLVYLGGKRRRGVQLCDGTTLG